MTKKIKIHWGKPGVVGGRFRYTECGLFIWIAYTDLDLRKVTCKRCWKTKAAIKLLVKRLSTGKRIFQNEQT